MSMEENDYYEREAIKVILNALDCENPALSLCNQFAKLIQEASRLKNESNPTFKIDKVPTSSANQPSPNPSIIKPLSKKNYDNMHSNLENFYCPNVAKQKLRSQEDIKALSQVNDCKPNTNLWFKKGLSSLQIKDDLSKIDILKKGDLLQLKDGQIGLYHHLGYKQRASMQETDPTSIGVTVQISGKDCFYPLADILHPIRTSSRRASYDSSLSNFDGFNLDNVSRQTASQWTQYGHNFWNPGTSRLPAHPRPHLRTNSDNTCMYLGRSSYPGTIDRLPPKQLSPMENGADSCFDCCCDDSAQQPFRYMDSIHTTDSGDSGYIFENMPFPMGDVPKRRESLV